ncbi:hypothetical protein B0T16DRAFT_102522 [Cercophora newfieldiana]|uniref:Uncharacterized protein n=1 Tax=Cercophora newfieldiana TaxID=92897 RepID=A0AA39YH18_9PEZI|nr:hypothetical protein B0T16DRAFT_102522 [Cercophora newfieldiana]
MLAKSQTISHLVPAPKFYSSPKTRHQTMSFSSTPAKDKEPSSRATETLSYRKSPLPFVPAQNPRPQLTHLSHPRPQPRIPHRSTRKTPPNNTASARRKNHLPRKSPQESHQEVGRPSPVGTRPFHGCGSFKLNVILTARPPRACDVRVPAKGEAWCRHASSVFRNGWQAERGYGSWYGEAWHGGRDHQASW